MGRPKYTYNYDHDTDTTTIISAEKINGKIVTTTKTVEGNQIPKQSHTSRNVVLGLLAIGSLNMLLTTVPHIVVTPVAIFGALKLTKDKKTNEKVIAGVGAGVLSLIACSTFFEPSAPRPTRSYSNTIKLDSGKEITREELQQTRILCKKASKEYGMDTEHCWKYSDQ